MSEKQPNQSKTVIASGTNMPNGMSGEISSSVKFDTIAQAGQLAVSLQVPIPVPGYGAAVIKKIERTDQIAA